MGDWSYAVNCFVSSVDDVFVNWRLSPLFFFFFNDTATTEIYTLSLHDALPIFDYSDRLLHKMSAQVLVLIDGSDSSVAGQAINVTTAIGLDESLRRVLQNRDTFAVDMRPKLLFNPDSRSPNFFLPGLTAVLLLNVTTFLTAFSIVREKERGTLEQLFVTPVRPMGLLFGKLLPYLAIGFAELCLILTFMRFVFQVPIHGNVLVLAFLSLPYLFVSLSIGILVSSKANSQSEAI